MAEAKHDSLTSLNSSHCPLCFEKCSDNERQMKIIHDTPSDNKHYACTVCLKKLRKESKIACPHCRQEVNLAGSIDQLPTFTGADKEHSFDDVTYLKEVVQSSITVNCSSCDEPRSAWCGNCSIFLCTLCKEHHLRQKYTKQHDIREVNLAGSIDQLPTFTGADKEHSFDDVTYLKEVVQSSITVNCSSCDEPRSAWCGNCSIFLCTLCKEHHLRQKYTKQHDIRDLSSLDKDETSKIRPVVLCSKHGVAVDMYCPKCETSCCKLCDEHIQHRYVELGSILEDKAQTIKVEGKRQMARVKQLQEDIVQLQKWKEKVTLSKTESLAAIDARIPRIIDHLHNKQTQLKAQLSNGNDQLTTAIDTEIERREQILAVTSQLYEQFDTFQGLEKPTQLEMYTSIEKAFDSLKAMPAEVTCPEDVGYFFKANDRHVHDMTHMEIGHIYNASSFNEDDQLSGRSLNVETQDMEMRVHVIGKKKSGRTKLLSAFMPKEVFISGRAACGPGLDQWRSLHKEGNFILSKTPGIEKRDVLNDVDSVARPGPHVLLFVIKNPDDDVSTLDTYRDLFLDDPLDFVIIVFTGKKDLDKRGFTISSYIQTRRDGPLANLLKAVKERYLVVCTDEMDTMSLFKDKLFRLCRQLVQQNGRRYLHLKSS